MNLVYMCVFYNSKYIRLLELLFLSLRVFSSRDSFDILILTSDDFQEQIRDLADRLQVPCKIHCIPCTSIFEAACSRLHVFDWPEIGRYKKILYLDTDIIVRRDLSSLFSFDLEDILYGIPSGTLKSHHFGGEFFDFATIDPSTPGMNSGTMLFTSSNPVRDLFSRILCHAREYSSTSTPPYALDQPFINYHGFISSMCNTTLLTPYVSLYEDTMIVDNADTALVCHFSYPIGNFEHKYKRMSVFFESLLNTPHTEMKCTHLIGKQYSWENGYIRFNDTGIETSWGRGVCKMLDVNVVYAMWNNYVHILKFNTDCTKFMSIRTAPMDFECIWGMILAT